MIRRRQEARGRAGPGPQGACGDEGRNVQSEVLERRQAEERRPAGEERVRQRLRPCQERHRLVDILDSSTAVGH